MKPRMARQLTVLAFLTCLAYSASRAAEPTPAVKAPITAAMREALERISKIPGPRSVKTTDDAIAARLIALQDPKVSAKTIDDAVEALHKEIARQDPKVFVPLAIPHLMRLAPHETRTRILLRKALAKGWLEEYSARALLVQSGDTPGPHIQALTKGVKADDRKIYLRAIQTLIKGLEAGDGKVRIRIILALGSCGAPAEPALPKLRAIVAKAKASPALKDDFVRAYTIIMEVPVHVRAQWAIYSIEAEVKKRNP